MEIKVTKNKDYSLQFFSDDEAKAVLEHLDQNDEVKKLRDNLLHRLSSEYAHDNVACTTIVFSNEVPLLLALGLVADKPKASLFNKWFKN